MDNVNVIEVIGLHRAIGGVPLLRGVSLAIAAGEATALIGPSGSGKTTLLRLIAGLEEPTAGRVLLGGRLASQCGLVLAPHRRGIGMVFQRPTLWPHLTVAQNVAFGLGSWPRPEARRRMAQVVEMTHLEGLERRRPHQLSGGEAQRVALARAIAPQPGILLLDEPLTGLDPQLHQAILDLFRQVRRETGVTLLYVSHDHDEAASITDRVLCLQQGLLEYDGTWAMAGLLPSR